MLVFSNSCQFSESVSFTDLSIRGRRNFNPKTMQINIGTHTLKLYQPPVPDPSQIPFDEIPSHNDWRRYKKSTLRIHIFQGNPRPGSLTPSDLSEDGEEVLPEYSWLPSERSKAPRDPFLSGDGFDVYVDGCRFLPDSVTFTKVCFNGSSFHLQIKTKGQEIFEHQCPISTLCSCILYTGTWIPMY